MRGLSPFSGSWLDSRFPAGFGAETHQGLHNLQTVLAGCSLALADVLQVRIYLLHFDRDYETMNQVYAAYFPPGRRPARTCVGVSGLAKGALIEIDMVARRTLPVPR